MKTYLPLFCTLLFCSVSRAGDAVGEMAGHLRKETPALVVAVCGPGDRDLAAIARLVQQTAWTVFCRGAASPGLDEIRNWARENDLLGKRVYVAEGNAESLWLAGELADAVWVSPGLAHPPPEKEILRVLRPGGVGVSAGKVVTRPAASGADEWRHPYHGPDNNPVSRDRLARLPGELRFQTRPVFAPMPNQTLVAGGRIFFFSGHIAFHDREEPLLNTLTVLNAYNGLRLWTRPLDPNHVVHNMVKAATANEVVFAEGPTLWVLDAATGGVRGKFSAPAEAAAAGDTDWKWIAQENGKLWAALGPPDGRVAPYRGKRPVGHWPWDVANAQYKNIIANFGVARTLAAFQFPQMKPLWSAAEPQPLDARALCLEGGRIFELAPGQYMAARDAASGEPLWRKTPETSPELFAAIGAAIHRQNWGLGWASYCCARADRGVVCIAGPPFKQTVGIGLEKGDLLWKLGMESPHPFFLDGGLFLVPRVAQTSFCRKLDPRTGKQLEQFDLGVTGSCTRLTATPSQFFYRPGGGIGKTVYADIAARILAPYEGIVRPGCFDGVLPAGGRLYWMPLACDCWQVHGTFCLAPRAAAAEHDVPAEPAAWAAPGSAAAAAADDWPMFRANAAGTATVAAGVGHKVRELWRRRVPGSPTAPIAADGRVYVGAADGTLHALDAADGKALWQASTGGAILQAPAYWQGRVACGSCDGGLYCWDARDGRVLGRAELAPRKRFVNIMDRLVSAWPLGGGVVLDDAGIAYTAAGSTAVDGTLAAAVDLASGRPRWQRAYTPDGKNPALSFGVQANILLQDKTLYISGGAPVGIVALDALTGGNPRVVGRFAVGSEMFLGPDGTPASSGPELFSGERTKPTLFSKPRPAHAYFTVSGRHVALVSGRLFGARDAKALDRIVDLMGKDVQAGGKWPNGIAPRDPMSIPADAAGWALGTADVCGLAVGSDGLVALHSNSVEGIAPDGRSLWTFPLPCAPLRWGLALTGRQCVVTLTSGLVVCLAKEP